MTKNLYRLTGNEEQKVIKTKINRKTVMFWQILAMKPQPF